MLHAMYCHMFCAFGIAVLQIVYCVLSLVCAMGTALLCACLVYCHMLCTIGTAASCTACDVLVPQIYWYVPKDYMLSYQLLYIVHPYVSEPE